MHFAGIQMCRGELPTLSTGSDKGDDHLTGCAPTRALKVINDPSDSGAPHVEREHFAHSSDAEPRRNHPCNHEGQRKGPARCAPPVSHAAPTGGLCRWGATSRRSLDRRGEVHHTAKAFASERKRLRVRRCNPVLLWVLVITHHMRER